MDKEKIEQLRQCSINISIEKSRLFAADAIRKQLKEDQETRRIEKREEKSRKRIERSEKRLGTFTELAQINRSLTKKAEHIYNLRRAFTSESGDQSPWILLAEGDKQHGGWVAGLIQRRFPEDKKAKSSVVYDFKIYVTDYDSILRIRDNPQNTRVKSPEPTVESLLPVSYMGEINDFVISEARRNSRERFFNPVHALKRRLLIDRFSNQLANVQETIDVFETAVTDVSLNPHLKQHVHLLESASA